MEPAQKQKVMLFVAVVALIAAGVLIVRGLGSSGSGGAKELDEKARRGLSTATVSGFDSSALPPQGDMSDEEYARLLIKLREQAYEEAAGDVEPGAARKLQDD